MNEDDSPDQRWHASAPERGRRRSLRLARVRRNQSVSKPTHGDASRGPEVTMLLVGATTVGLVVAMIAAAYGNSILGPFGCFTFALSRSRWLHCGRPRHTSWLRERRSGRPSERKPCAVVARPSSEMANRAHSYALDSFLSNTSGQVAKIQAIR